ncbi:MAG: carbohydrate binding family 9 domain-containing protein, partial [Candidatus Marinimicrobia bacterium]|nr:carbohydrate binding family 9 domain-containing protein [Candidatus Neomarinimicrobiota bacterium]
MKNLFIALAILLCGTQLLPAAEAQEYSAVRTNLPPQIDGRLDDACWASAPFSGEFRMHKPYDDRPASFDTRFAIVYDNNSLYIAVFAEDPEPGLIFRQVTRRDNISSEFVALFFDSYHDRNTAYCFLVTASGVLGDLFFSQNGEVSDPSWNAVWWAKTDINDRGWTAEFRIPLSQLRFVDAPEQIWGFDVMRNVHRNDEESFWDAVLKNESGYVHQFGVLRGLKDIKARKTLEILPYAVAHLDTYEAESGNPFRDGSDLKANAGLDGKIGLSNNFTLDFTINPDFGQVESDPATVNLSAFETFFEERRPFFIEGNNITRYTLDVNGSEQQLFHSRRIGRTPHYWPDTGDSSYADIPGATGIIAAAKITGRTDRGLSIGIIESLTRNETARLYEAGIERDISVEPLTNYAVAALRQDLNGGETQVGGILTAVNRNLTDAHLDFLHAGAYTGGFDLRHYGKDRVWQADLRAYGSYVHGSAEALSNTQLSPGHLFQRPDAPWVLYDSTRTSLWGHGGSLRIGKFSGSFQAAVKTQWKSPGLELNDIGFMLNTDEIDQNVWLSYRKTAPFWIMNNLYTSFNHHYSWNFGGMYQGSETELLANGRFKNLSAAEIGLGLQSESLSSTSLRGGPRLRRPGNWHTWLWYGTNNRKDLQAQFLGVIQSSKDDLVGGHHFEIEAYWKISQ